MEKLSDIRIEDCWYKSVCRQPCSSYGCIRYLEMKYLMENSNIPKVKQIPQSLTAPSCDRDAFKRLAEIKKDIVEFVDCGCNLYIASKVTGNGKTSWSIKLMLKYFDNIWAGNGFRTRAIFIHVPTFLLKCKEFNKKDEAFDEMKDSLSTVDLVVWDDIASTDVSAYDYSQLLMYIDNRLLNEKSNIFTGNYDDRASLEKRLGMKLASRIWSDTTEVITFNGGDMR